MTDPIPPTDRIPVELLDPGPDQPEFATLVAAAAAISDVRSVTICRDDGRITLNGTRGDWPLPDLNADAAWMLGANPPRANGTTSASIAESPQSHE